MQIGPMEILPFFFIGNVVGWYTFLYFIVWLIAKMNGNPPPKYFFWRGKKRTPRLPTDNFREAYHRLLDEGWTNEDIITFLKREYRTRNK